MSARRQEAEELIQELEALRNYLLDDGAVSEAPTFQDVPASTTEQKPANKPASVSYLNVKSAPHISEAMKDELRSQASPLIQEFVDREMIKLEHQLIQTLHQHLERWMDSYTLHQSADSEPESSYYHSNQQ